MNRQQMVSALQSMAEKMGGRVEISSTKQIAREKGKGFSLFRKLGTFRQSLGDFVENAEGWTFEALTAAHAYAAAYFKQFAQGWLDFAGSEPTGTEAGLLSEFADELHEAASVFAFNFSMRKWVGAA